MRRFWIAAAAAAAVAGAALVLKKLWDELPTLDERADVGPNWDY